MTAIPEALELAGYTLGAQHPVTRTWVDDAERLRRLAGEHEIDVRLALDLDLAARRAARFAPHAAPESLLNRWTELGDLRAMLSIRFEGGDPDRPFVDATPLSRPVTPDDLPELRAAAREVFGGFGPRYLRLWSAEPAGHFPGGRPDKRFLAGEITVLRRPGHGVPEGLTLRPAAAVTAYEQARRAYDDVRAAHPEHVGQAALQSEDDLREDAEAGLLFEVRVHDRWAGYVSANPDDDSLGLPAYVVQELVLAAECRGLGFGPHLNTLLARALPDGETVLLGTIHADNRGARRAALAAGRVDVGGWFRLPL